MSGARSTGRPLQFRAAARDHGIRGLWFGPPYGHFHANDKSAYPFYEVAVEFDAAVYFHHGGGIGGGGGNPSMAPMKYARPLLLDVVVIDFPDLRMNIEHMAYPWTEELFALMKRAPNVHADVSDDWDFSRYSQKVEKETSWLRRGLNRQLESSGWPQLTEEEIDGILGGNARRLLKIDRAHRD